MRRNETGSNRRLSSPPCETGQESQHPSDISEVISYCVGIAATRYIWELVPLFVDCSKSDDKNCTYYRCFSAGGHGCSHNWLLTLFLSFMQCSCPYCRFLCELVITHFTRLGISVRQQKVQLRHPKSGEQEKGSLWAIITRYPLQTRDAGIDITVCEHGKLSFLGIGTLF